MVSTNFTEIYLKSRLIGQEAAYPGEGGPGTGRGLQGPDRARRVVPGTAGRTLHPDHPLQPFAGLPGPASLSGLRFPVFRPWCWTPVLPTRYTPSRYPPVLHPGPVHHRRALAVIVMHSHPNTPFWTPVGEPRGSRTHPGYGSQTGYIQLLTGGRVYTAVCSGLWLFYDCFMRFPDCFHEVSMRFP